MRFMPPSRIPLAIGLLGVVTSLACAATESAHKSGPDSTRSAAKHRQSPSPSVAHPKRTASSIPSMQPWSVAENVAPLRLSAFGSGSDANPDGCLSLTRGLVLPVAKAPPGVCVQGQGYWGEGAVLVHETREKTAGYRVIVPFSFVTDKNPSLGWPGWYALSAILVDRGWVSSESLTTRTFAKGSGDPLFEGSKTLRGIVQPAPAQLALLWKHFDHLQMRSDWPPYGREKLPFLVSAPFPDAD